VFVRFGHAASIIVKRESPHRVSGCNAARIRLHSQRHWHRHTTADRMAAHRKLNRRHVYLCVGGLRKCARVRKSLIAWGCYISLSLIDIGLGVFSRLPSGNSNIDGRNNKNRKNNRINSGNKKAVKKESLGKDGVFTNWSLFRS
jgi:hypothetical protein